MTPKFQKFQGTNGQYYFRLRAGNGQIILTSEGYQSTSGRDNGIQSVKDNAPYDHRYYRLTSRAGQPYFVLRAGNGQTIGTSEMYSSPSARENGIEAVKRDAPLAIIE